MKTIINIILIIAYVLMMMAMPSCGKGDDRDVEDPPYRF